MRHVCTPVKLFSSLLMNEIHFWISFWKTGEDEAWRDTQRDNRPPVVSWTESKRAAREEDRLCKRPSGSTLQYWAVLITRDRIPLFFCYHFKCNSNWDIDIYIKYHFPFPFCLVTVSTPSPKIHPSISCITSGFTEGVGANPSWDWVGLWNGYTPDRSPV